MTRLRLSGRNLVSASCGSYQWLSAANTRKESSRDGMAISLKSGFSRGGNDVTTLAQRGIPGLAVRSEACCWCGSVDDGEIHGRRRGEFSVAVAVYVDLHDHRPPAGPPHPGRSNAKELLAIMTAVDSPEKILFASTAQAFCKEAPVRRVRELHAASVHTDGPHAVQSLHPAGGAARQAAGGADARPRHPRPPAA